MLPHLQSQGLEVVPDEHVHGTARWERRGGQGRSLGTLDRKEGYSGRYLFSAARLRPISSHAFCAAGATARLISTMKPCTSATRCAVAGFGLMSWTGTASPFRWLVSGCTAAVQRTGCFGMFHRRAPLFDSGAYSRQARPRVTQ